jgi:hypothetical protein
MPDPQKISTLTPFDDVPDGDTLFYGLFDGTDDYTFTGNDLRRMAYNSITGTTGRTPNAAHYYELNGASAITLTLTAPTAGDVIEIYRVGTGGVTHLVVLPTGVDWDGSGNGTANFADDGDYLRAIAISATRWRVLPSTTGVTFSA